MSKISKCSTWKPLFWKTAGLLWRHCVTSQLLVFFRLVGGPAKLPELVQPWHLLEGPDQPQRGELNQAFVPTLQVEGSSKVPSSLSVSCSQRSQGVMDNSPEMLSVEQLLKGLSSGAGNSRPICQQRALTISCRASLWNCLNWWT